MSMTMSVSNETELNAALALLDLTGPTLAPDMAFTIDLSSDITLASDLDAIDLGHGDTLTIDGNGHTLDGAGAYRGLFAYAGQTTVNDLTIENTIAKGGDGAGGGGGGAGLGGGLFVASAASVTLDRVDFLSDAAVGGNGGPGGTGGGGGLGGNGALDGGGGGIGSTAAGGTIGQGSPGILLGAANGGGGGAGMASGLSAGGGAAGADGLIRTDPENGDPVGVGGSGGFGGGGGSGGVYTIQRYQDGQDASLGGSGGFGGGGAGGIAGASGGFGGGGGGGGGFNAGQGGFGALAGNGEGGGGLGAGGAVFVQQGGTLIYGSGQTALNLVAGGLYAVFAESGVGPAEALGSGLFIEGTEQVTFAPQTGDVLTISDTIADDGHGSLLVDGEGILLLSGDNTYAGGTTLASGTLVLASANALGTGALVFDGPAALRIDIGALDTPIAGLGSGDEIDLSTLAYDEPGTAVLNLATDVLTVTEFFGSATLQLSGDYLGDRFTLSRAEDGGTEITVTAPCYCRGTRILTDAGDIPVEDLRVGDRLVTLSGAVRPLIWIGRRVAAAPFADKRAMAPVLIRAGALADRVPTRDLRVSPDHGLYLDGVLVQAIALVNGATIIQPDCLERVEYFHLELETHDVILAEGAPAETYLDTGNRHKFSNCPLTHRPTPPTDLYADLIFTGARLEAIRATLPTAA